MRLTSLNIAANSDNGAEMIVLHLSERTPLIGDDGQPVMIRLRGKDSEAFVESEYDAQQKNQDAIVEGGKLERAKARALEANKMLARCTVGWRNIPQGWIDGTDDETPATFSYDAALTLYSNRGLRWVREQVDKFVGDRGNFLKA